VGTTSYLQSGDVWILENLLFAMMMPSGNDVAFAISQFFGYKLFQKKYCSADKEKKMSL